MNKMSEEEEGIDDESDIQPSVLTMLKAQSRAQGDSRMAKLLREDRFARERFVQWGVPLGRVEAERLRFRGWQRLFGIRAAGVEDVQWSPSGEAIACLTHGALELLRWPGAAAQRHVTRLPYTGSRVRWAGAAEVVLCSGSSGRLVLADLHGAEVRLSAFDCEALTTLQDVVGTEQGLLYAGGRDGSLFVWDRRASVRCVQTSDGRGQGSLNCVELARDGQMLLTASAAGALGVWDVRKTARQPAALYALPQLGLAGGAARSLGAMRLEPESNSRVALQLAGDGRCSLFDLASLSAVPLLGPAAAGEDERSVAGLAFLPGAPWLAATGARCIKLAHTGRQRKEATLDVHAAVSCLSCHAREGLVYGTRAGELVVFGFPH